MASQPGALGVFRHRIYRLFWISSVISNTGGMIQLVGAGWLMTLLTPSPSMVALVQASVAAPVVVVSYIAGVLADSRDRRSLMLFAQIFMLVVSIVLALLAWTGALTPWTLLICTFLIGLGMALHNPPWQASLNEMVPREDIPAAVSMNAMGMNVTRSAGPALGGAVVAVLGAATAFAINAVTYLAMIVTLLLWRPAPVDRRLPRENFSRASAAGLRYLFLSPGIVTMDLRAFVFGFAASVVQALLPVLVRDRLGGDATVYGILLGAFGAGAVLGALNSYTIRRYLGHESIARAGFAIYAAACVVIALSTNVWLTGLMVIISGFSWINVITLINACVQLSVPRWVLGRIISLFMTFIFAGMAIGSWAWGAVAEAHGLLTAFLSAAAVLLGGVLFGLRFPMPDIGGLDLEPLNRFNEPKLKLDLHRRSGPIMIMVEYRIDQTDETEFLTLIAQRRRIRIRDGARRWALLRDLEDPDLWIESYHFPTWTEYVRHVDRRTKSDEAAISALHALNRAPPPLKVHRMIERETVQLHDDMPRVSHPTDDLHP